MPAPSQAQIDAVLNQADAAFGQSRENLAAFLRIPSVSAQPAHAADCVRAAEWMREQLAALGFAAALRPTAGHPVVLAHHPGPADYRGPHVLFYGHYDVQPPEPLDLWNSPPFEPQLVEGPHGERIVARGAVDDKGQVMMFVEALRAWQLRIRWRSRPGHGADRGRGGDRQPQSGAVSCSPKDQLRSDLALISDTGMWDVDTPAITTRLRGMLYAQVTLKGPPRDLHSGLFGGSALNPINALTRMLGGLHDAGAASSIPGFYDEVREIVSKPRRRNGERSASTRAAFLGQHRPVGHRRASRIGPRCERLWARPTAGHQRHLGRLHRRRQQDRHRLGSVGQAVVPSGARVRIRRR